MLGLRKLVGLWSALRFELEWTLRRPRLLVQLQGFDVPMTVHRGASDWNVFREVFIRNELELSDLEPPRVILDGGANVGYTTAWFARKYPHAKVIAVEPDEENCRRISEHCAGLRNVKVFRGGVWWRKAQVHIVNPEDSAWAFRVEECPVETPGSVPAWSIADILREVGEDHIDLLKLDVEGAEREIFAKGTDEWLKRVGTVMIEIHGPEAQAAVDSATVGFDRWAQGDKAVLTRPRLDPLPGPAAE